MTAMAGIRSMPIFFGFGCVCYEIVDFSGDFVADMVPISSASLRVWLQYWHSISWVNMTIFTGSTSFILKSFV